jgi:hypothetical protein
MISEPTLYVGARWTEHDNVPRRREAIDIPSDRLPRAQIIGPYGQIICTSALVGLGPGARAQLGGYRCFSARISRTSGVIMSESVVSAVLEFGGSFVGKRSRLKWRRTARTVMPLQLLGTKQGGSSFSRDQRQRTSGRADIARCMIR